MDEDLKCFYFNTFGTAEMLIIKAKVAELPGNTMIRIESDLAVFEIEKATWAESGYSAQALVNRRVA